MPCTICDYLQQHTDLLVIDAPAWRLALSTNQIYLGQAMLVSTRHLSDPAELEAPEQAVLNVAKNTYERLTQRLFQATRVDWSCSPEDVQEDLIPIHHIYWAARPRYATPPTIRGRLWADPNYDEPCTTEKSYLATASELEYLAHRLRSQR